MNTFDLTASLWEMLSTEDKSVILTFRRSGQQLLAGSLCSVSTTDSSLECSALLSSPRLLLGCFDSEMSLSFCSLSMTQPSCTSLTNDFYLVSSVEVMLEACRALVQCYNIVLIGPIQDWVGLDDRSLSDIIGELSCIFSSSNSVCVLICDGDPSNDRRLLRTMVSSAHYLGPVAL